MLMNEGWQVTTLQKDQRGLGTQPLSKRINVDWQSTEPLSAMDSRGLARTEDSLNADERVLTVWTTDTDNNGDEDDDLLFQKR